MPNETNNLPLHPDDIQLSWLKKIINIMPSSVIVRNKDSQILLASPFFENLFQTSPKRLNGQKLENLVKKDPLNHDFIQQIMDNTLDIIQHGNPRTIPELPLTLPNGKIRWFKIQSLPFPMENNQVGILDFATDITESRESQTLFLELQNIVDHSRNVAFTWVNQDGWPVDYVSHNVLKLTGYTHHEFLNGNIQFASLIHPEDLSRVSQEVQTGAQDPCASEIAHKPYRIITKNREEKVIQDRTFIVRDNQGNATHFKGIVEDITESHRLQNDIIEREAKFRTIFNSVLTGIVIIDAASKKIVDINSVALEMIGDTQENIIGKICHGFICPAEINQCPVTDLQEEIDHSERILIRSDGTRIPIIKSVTKIMINNKEHLIDCFISISPLKNAQIEIEKNLKELSKAKKLMKQVFDLLPMDVYWKDHNLKYLGGNQHFAHNVGLDSPDQLIGKSYTDLPIKPCAHIFYDEDRKVIETNQSRLNQEEACNRPDGSTIWLTYNKVPLTNTSNEVIGVVSVDFDTTLRKQQEMILKKMYSDLEATHQELKFAQNQLIQSEKLASLGQLAAGIAHEINNPLGFISNNIDTLKIYIQNYTDILDGYTKLTHLLNNNQHDAARTQAEYLETLASSLNMPFVEKDILPLIDQTVDGIQRIRNIVDSLKLFSRNNENQKLSNQIEEIIDSATFIVWSEIKYKTDLRKMYGTLPAVKCNAQKISQVIINLLLNASQSIQEKGIITIKTYLENNMACINITDTGEGISEKNINKIFDPFFTTKEIGKGTGLGLSIAYDIIKQHGGKLLVSSEIGKGSSFTIKLPLT